MTNKSSIPTAWWTKSRYDIPDVPADRMHIAVGWRNKLVQEIQRARPETARALAHAVWGISHWADRSTKNKSWVSIKWVVNGCGSGRAAGRTAVTSLRKWLLLESDTKNNHYMTDEARLACYWATNWAIVAGYMEKPIVDVSIGPGTPLYGPIRPGKGSCRCPCDGHANNDRRASASYDTDRLRLTCHATSKTFILSGSESTWSIHTRTSPQPATSASPQRTAPNRYSSGRTGVVGALIRGSLSRGPYGSSMSQEVSGSRTLGGLMRWYDAQHNGPVATSAAWRAAHNGSDLPDQLVRMDRGVVSEWLDSGMKTPDGRVVYRAVAYENTGTNLVLFDLDGLSAPPVGGWAGTVTKIRDLIAQSNGPFKSVVSVVETSETGVQVVVDLHNWEADARAFHAAPMLRGRLRTLGIAMIKIVGRGGHADESAWAQGRYARLPGARVTKYGDVFNARLRFVQR